MNTPIRVRHACFHLRGDDPARTKYLTGQSVIVWNDRTICAPQFLWIQYSRLRHLILIAKEMPLRRRAITGLCPSFSHEFYRPFRERPNR